MKRLALAVVAALSGTGCFYGDCDRSVTVDWSFQDADGRVTASCTTAGVRDIDILVNGARVGTFDCQGPAVAVALGRGGNRVTVEARDASRAILYRDDRNVDASSCGHQGVLDAVPSEGRVLLGYTFSPMNACVSPGPSFIWVLVRDDLTGEVAADSAAAPEAGNVCGVNFPLTFRLAAGAYTLVSTEEVVRNGTFPETYSTVGRDCRDYAFDVRPAAETGLAPVLVDGGACL